MTKTLIISTFLLATMLAGGNAQTHSDGTLRDCMYSTDGTFRGSNTCERWDHCAWDDGRGVCFNYCPAITDPESCRQLPGCSLVERSNRCDFDSAPPTPPPKPTPEPLRDCDELNDRHCGNHDHCLLGPQGCFNDCPNIDDPLECQNLSGCALVNRSNRCDFARWSSQNMLIQSDGSDEYESSSLRGGGRKIPLSPNPPLRPNPEGQEAVQMMYQEQHKPRRAGRPNFPFP